MSTPISRALVVNADDFGFTPDVNEGIVEAHLEGILTATTLMANGAAFDHAVALAHATPSLDVGCHLAMVQGMSLSNPLRALPADIPALLIALGTGSIDPCAELSAQVRRILAAGIRPTHLDTHKHTHLLPPVLDAVVRIAHEFGIPWVRRPFDFPGAPGAGLKKQATAATMRLSAPAFARALSGLRCTDHFAGFQLTGALNTDTLLEALRALPPGLTELMCHPGHLGPQLQSAGTRLKESRAIELAALTSPEARREIARLGIRLTSYLGE